MKKKILAWLLCLVMVLTIAPLPAAYAADGDPTTFVLSNEEGGLIDHLIAAGYGTNNMYELLANLQETSGGVITDEFLETLAACPAGSEIFTVPLSGFGGDNNPVCVNTDGTLSIQPIFGRDYYGDTGYSTYPPDISGAGREIFTYADNPAYYIDAGENVGGGRYHAFAIAWAQALTVAGTATDDTAILQIDNKTPSARDKTWEINVTSGTVKAGLAKADVTLTGLPAGLDYTAAKGVGNTIVITLTGAANVALAADANITAVIKGSAVTEAGALDSANIALKLWYIGPGTTFVISSELGTGYGGLIDALVAAGHGGDTMYEVLELLQPDFSGVITERFMKTLRSTPANSEVFDDAASLSNFALTNNPIGVNADGTLRINPIFGRDHVGDTGYTTAESYQNGVGFVWATSVDSEAYLIFAGEREVGISNYYAFAVAWMPSTVPTFMLSNEESGLIDQLIAAGHGADSLYEVLQLLQPVSGGAIPADFMAALAACPVGCDAKTADLSNFADASNNPIGIGADGNIIVAQIYGRDYDGSAGFTTGTGTLAGVGNVRFTAAGSEGDFLDAGTKTDGGVTYYYKAFAIAWMSTGGGDPGPVAPTVVTNDASGITTSGATLGGNVTASGGATVTERGFVYGSSANPTIGGAGVTKVTVGDGTGSFNTAITGLAASTPYHVRAYATNAAGTSYGSDVSFTTSAADTTAPAAPTITVGAGSTTDNTPTVGGTAEAGSTVTLYVDGVACGTTVAAGDGSWAFTLPAAVADGNHSVTATATDAAGNTSAASGGTRLTVAAVSFAALSARAHAGAGEETLILGFVFAGNGKSTLVRGVGPGLADAVADHLADPQLRLYAADGTPVADNDDWAGTPALSDAFARTGAGALAADSKDAALLATLPGRLYTAHVSGAAGGDGVALAEAYDADLADTGGRLAALSVRSRVGTGDDILIAGFVITGEAPKRVVVRGVGPGLAGAVASPLADPELHVWKLNTATGDWVVVGENDDWDSTPATADLFESLGMGALVAGSKDAALVLMLEPGIYTAQMRGVGGATGVGLMELYEAQ